MHGSLYVSIYYSYNSNMLIALVSIKPVSPVFLVCCAGVSIILERVFHKSQYSVFELYLVPIVLAPPFLQSFVSARQFFLCLLQTQLWCPRPSQKLVWIVIPQSFQGNPQRFTWCQQFGLQIFSKLGDADFCPQKNTVFRFFFGQNKFSWPDSQLSPIAFHTYLESLWISG